MAYQLKEINQRARTDAEGFLRECDAGYTAKIVIVADKILKNLAESPVVLLSGPSGSGKTTTALKIKEELKKRGINTHTVSMDDYFLDQNPDTMPRTPEGDLDFESPDILDIALLGRHFDDLRSGREIQVPCFNFTSQQRDRCRAMPLRLGRDEVAVFEGIHALNPAIALQQAEAFGLYISARSNVLEGDILRFKATWMRLTRRAVRDLNFRGKELGTTFSMWNSVRRGEKTYISPYKHTAHVMLDSSLPCEVPVMAAYAASLAQAIPAETPRRAELEEMTHAFSYFEHIDAALVPKDSLLREFLGGGIYGQGMVNGEGVGFADKL